MRVLVCGDRNWTNREAIMREILNLGCLIEAVIEGECRGADLLARSVAEELHIPVMPFAADWRMGRAAGPIRNQRMLDEGAPDAVFAFHANVEKSKGTADMIRRARAYFIPVKIVTE